MCEKCKKNIIKEWTIKQTDENSALFGDLERRAALYAQIENLQKKLHLYYQESDFLKGKIYKYLEENHGITVDIGKGLTYKFEGGDLLIMKFKDSQKMQNNLQKLSERMKNLKDLEDFLDD
jgi:regulator of replication initiation timing